jgi:hypothetical protein
MELIHGHNELRDIVTAFPEEDPGIFQRMLLGDPFLCRAVNDLIFAINAGGPRMAAYLQSLSRGVFHDAKPADFLALYYKMMNYQEAPFDQLGASGLSPDYVAKETKRALAGVAGETKIYPGIDIDVPVLGAGPAATDKKTKPEDVSRALRAAFGAGADGVVLSREYVEMWLANLTAAGDTLREIFAQAASKS